MEEKFKEIAIPNITINPTDIKILLICINPISVSNLQRATNVAYKNLLPHLKKLKDYKFITIKEYGRGKPKEILTNADNKNVWGFLELMSLDKAQWQEVVKRKNLRKSGIEATKPINKAYKKSGNTSQIKPSTTERGVK